MDESCKAPEGHRINKGCDVTVNLKPRISRMIDNANPTLLDQELYINLIIGRVPPSLAVVISSARLGKETVYI
jgi:hypothetical protein